MILLTKDRLAVGSGWLFMQSKNITSTIPTTAINMTTTSAATFSLKSFGVFLY